MKQSKIFLTIFLVLFSTNFVFSASINELMRKGNKAYKKQDYLSALENYKNALAKSPKNQKIKFNIGNAFYRLNDFEKAQTLWKEATKDLKINSKAFYNEGNAYFKRSQYKEAVESYINAILANPNDSNAKHNLQIALEKLKLKSKQCNQKKDNQQDKNKQQKNEKQQNKNSHDNKQKDEKKFQEMSKENAQRLLEMMKEKERDSAKPNILNQRFQRQKRSQEQFDKDW